MKKSILYLTNVPWGWIKQRPHFLAEYLSRDFDVTVFQQHYLRNPFKNNFLVGDQVKETESFHIYDYILSPGGKILPGFVISLVNFFLVRILSTKLRHKYDVIWFSSPMVYERFKFLKGKAKVIIYDCMDDYLEFPAIKKNKKKSDEIKKSEREILEKATLTLFSADYLMKKVLSRYNLSVPNIIVNNAIEIPDSQNCLESEVCKNIKALEKPFVYIGTVSEWFDFKLILNLLDQHSDLNFVIIGPKLVPIPLHPRLHYFGPVEHNQVFSLISASYAVVMPFVINELIRSVNPVKLYEYIFSGKPVVAVRYEETEKFSRYVYLYNNIEEFNKILSAIEEENRTIEYLEDCKKFAEDNTWENRCKKVNSEIKALLE